MKWLVLRALDRLQTSRIIESQDVLQTFRERTGLDLHMRVGIHIGAVAYGVIGTSSPRFCKYQYRH